MSALVVHRHFKSAACAGRRLLENKNDVLALEPGLLGARNFGTLEVMRGLKVVLSPTVATGKALVLDSAHAELLVVDGFTVEVGYVGDDFTNNVCTILGEMRAIPVFRTVGALRLVTPKAA